MARLVLVGPDVWAAYLREEPEAVERVERLIGEGLARATEAVAAEAIRRAGTMEQVAVMREVMVDLPPLEAGRAAWVRAGELAWRIRTEGDEDREPDLVEAHAALAAHEAEAEVLTAEPGLEAAARFLGLEVRRP